MHELNVVVFVTVIMAVFGSSMAVADSCFQKQYELDKTFAKSFAFENVSDIAINHKDQHVLVLQRSHPPVSIWSSNGTLLYVWDTQDIGYPHSLTINHTSSTAAETTVWITDMAGQLVSGQMYGHCVKQFTYTGKFIQSIGNCGYSTNGSSLAPVQFDRVTDLAINSKGYIYVTDGDIGGLNNRVLVFDPFYSLFDVWNKDNKPGSGKLQFNLPHSIAIDWCDRVWITDAQNNRIQIVSSNGTFLKQWTCFENSLLYGIDISSGFVVVTTKNVSSGEPEILFLPILRNDCSKLDNFGTCTIRRRLVVKQDPASKTTGTISDTSTMLHSVAVDDTTGSLYLSMLPGKITPLKFSPVLLPPTNNFASCSGASTPSPWPRVWNATVLLTPFFAEDLQTAHVEYNDDLQAMHISLYSPNGEVKEYLNVKGTTYILLRNSSSVTCSGPHDYGWITPARDWLASYKCECKGTKNISNIETLAWTCAVHNLRDWYWEHRDNGKMWRMFFNNESNPIGLPVIGEYTMAHFSAYGDETTKLQNAYQICMKNSKQSQDYSKFNINEASPIKGLSYTDCSSISTLPNWPKFFHMTVTMIPVVLNNANPFPTQVIYDWERESQHTIMCESSQTYNAYMIRNNTYVLNRNLKTKSVDCLSHFNFGPPKPNWMMLDGCKCKGTIRNNPDLTPWNNTIIAVCPVAKDRVFWT